MDAPVFRGSTPRVAIPIFVKHVTMAIFRKDFAISHPPPAWVPRAIGKEHERFIVALIMAINSLSNQGYLELGSTASPTGKISPTGRGMMKEREHARDNPASSLEFDQLYLAAFAAIPPDQSVAAETPNPPPSPVRKVQKRKVQAKLKQEVLTLSNLGKKKTGAARVKRAVMRAVKKAPQAPKRRAPKGR